MKSFVQQLNERVVILGFDVENKIPKIDDIKKNIVEAEVLDVFPKVAQKKGSKGYDYEDLKPWCYPEGFIVYDEDCQKINEVKKRKKTDDLYYEEPEVKDLITLNQLHNFVITDENGIKRYGSCLVIYEKAIGIDENSQEKTIFLPKALCLISLKNILDSNRQFLIYLYRNIFAPSLTNSSANIKLSADLISHFTSILVKNKKNFQVADKEWHGCYQQIKNQIYKNKQINYAIIRQKCLLEFFISLLFTDTAQYLNNECEYLQIVGPNLKERENEIFRMYAKNQTYFCDNFSFKPLFQRLSIGNILLFLQAIIQEKQIILFCSDVNDIVTVCESMMSLIYPLVWKCIYIPFLPYQMWETLECMMPFIIGMHKKYKKFVLNFINMQEYRYQRQICD
ncbi:hypothetical protein PPERSA_02430 [Pseudocohnilembus persalinus]|uniref:UDENN domain-containing protein n=1 Tax=Pseudocohnilembus persalinus TaxID=266149 RepID=A0A0V0QAR3_PSEPJ|nr:hypothetical protein PPERSA_02430 [Pseudocohnilembus persalinus]|eukprot:KRW99318.1 hypothetical protein PPERSA_02430 [Pseudocohnilembus persalinus]